MAPTVSVVIPNYNGLKYNKACLEAMRRQSLAPDRVIVVDNGSADGSADAVERMFPEVELIRLPENTGFSGAVNVGLKASEGLDYCILLNNDTVAGRHFVEELVRAIERRGDVFSCQAKMLKMDDRSLLDGAGDYYCAFGWAFARGKGRPAAEYKKPADIFSSCAGAAIYDMKKLKETGLFDENHFAYLEDTDIGWRARLLGYRNVFVPRAHVLHVGSATSGSVYNLFKVQNSSRNSIYLIYKNMPGWMVALNAPLLLFGFTVKAAFFTVKGFGGTYVKGIAEGFKLCRKGNEEGRRFDFKRTDFKTLAAIELELLAGCVRRIL